MGINRRCSAKGYRSLKPNGVFVNADQVAGPTAELEERYKAWWLEQVRSLGATEEQVEASLYRQREDRCLPVEGAGSVDAGGGFCGCGLLVQGGSCLL